MATNMKDDSILNYCNKEEMKSIVYSMYKEAADKRGLELYDDLEQHILNQVDELMELYDIRADLTCFKVPLGENEDGEEMYTKPLMYLHKVEEVLSMFQENLAKMFLHILALEVDRYLESRNKEE